MIETLRQSAKLSFSTQNVPVLANAEKNISGELFGSRTLFVHFSFRQFLFFRSPCPKTLGLYQ